MSENKTTEFKLVNNDMGATFSLCRVWRYDLWRSFGGEKSSVAFIGLNPSTADEKKNDPTVTRCIKYAQRWGYSKMHMLNLFGLRSTDPRELYKLTKSDVIGFDNDSVIRSVCKDVSEIILCWGNHGRYLDRGRELFKILVKDGFAPKMRTLKITSVGHPGHPLYLKSDIEKRPLDYEAKCPECGVWSMVEWFDEIPPGGMWWIDSGSCPSCDKPILVESECEFRPRLFK
jgi:hypothetical protein